MSLLFQPTPDGTGIYLDWILSGLAWTLGLGIGAWIIALALGTVVGIARTLPGVVLPAIGRIYVEIFRNIPLLVQMFFWYFVLPELLPKTLGNSIKQMPPPWGSFVPALICLGTFTAARVAEQVRAGIQSIARGQAEAGFSLGMRRWYVYRLILLPQAFRVIVPAMTNEVMAIFKNTSVALTIGLIELTAAARAINALTFRTFEAFGIVTAIYLVMAISIWWIMHRIEWLARLPGTSIERSH